MSEVDLQGLVGVASYTECWIEDIQSEEYITEIPSWVDLTEPSARYHRIKTYEPTNKKFIHGLSQFIDSEKLQLLYIEIESEEFDIVYLLPTTNTFDELYSVIS